MAAAAGAAAGAVDASASASAGRAKGRRRARRRGEGEGDGDDDAVVSPWRVTVRFHDIPLDQVIVGVACPSGCLIDAYAAAAFCIRREEPPRRIAYISTTTTTTTTTTSILTGAGAPRRAIPGPRGGHAALQGAVETGGWAHACLCNWRWRRARVGSSRLWSKIKHPFANKGVLPPAWGQRPRHGHAEGRRGAFVGWSWW